jgi:hypothetical protein
VHIYEVIRGSQGSKVWMYIGHSGAKIGFMRLSMGHSGAKSGCLWITMDQSMDVRGS